MDKFTYMEGQLLNKLCFAYGIITIGFGFAAGSLGGVLKAALVLNGTVAGPLLGVFSLGVFLPFVNSKGAISGMLISHAISLTIGFGSLAFGRKEIPLPASIENCSNETLSKVTNLTAVYIKANNTMYMHPEPVEGFNKIFNLSYLLYPMVGTFVTVFVGVVVSLLTGPSEMTKDDEKYIHPVLVKIIRKFQKIYPANNASVSHKNDHEMNWRNGSNGVRAWTTDHSNMTSPTNVKQIRVGSSAYENRGFQES